LVLALLLWPDAAGAGAAALMTGHVAPGKGGERRSPHCWIASTKRMVLMPVTTLELASGLPEHVVIAGDS